MSVLIWCASDLEDLRRYAEEPEHWYRPLPPYRDSSAPGHNPKHTLAIGHFRIVFSITVGDAGMLFRHATIGRTLGALPSQAVVAAIVPELGYTGEMVEGDRAKEYFESPTPDRYLATPAPNGEPCILVVQAIGSALPSESN